MLEHTQLCPVRARVGVGGPLVRYEHSAAARHRPRLSSHELALLAAAPPNATVTTTAAPHLGDLQHDLRGGRRAGARADGCR